jgi:hypothetical protein
MLALPPGFKRNLCASDTKFITLHNSSLLQVAEKWRFLPAKDDQLERAALLTRFKECYRSRMFYWKLERSSSAICCEEAPLVKPK